MGQVICVASQKDGVGKTTTAINLSAAFALAEKLSLLIDCAPQGVATAVMGMSNTKTTRSLHHGKAGKALVENLLVGSDLDYLKMLPAQIGLGKAETGLKGATDGENQLRHLLAEIKTGYDYIIVDAPSSPSLLTINAITAADLLIAPIQCELQALEDLYDLLQAVKTVKSRSNPGIKIAGILLTMFEEGESLAQEFVREVRHHFNGMVFQTIIPRHSPLQDPLERGKPIALTDIMSIDAQCYLDLAEEIIGKWSTG